MAGLLFSLASPPRAAAQSALDVALPSPRGGEIAVRLFHPAPDNYRYHSRQRGAQVILVHGGTDAGTLVSDATVQALVREGLIAVKLLFPGGAWTDPRLGVTFRSSGIYDYRGVACMEALREVVRYCLALTPDTGGLLVTARLPAALPGNVGLLGLSNGGNIAFQTLARFGAAMPGLAFYAGWENPSNGQTCVGDLGTRDTDPDPAADGDGNGLVEDDGTNPYYLAYGPREFRMDFSNLHYDGAGTTVIGGRVYAGVAFHDGNGNLALDLPLDANGNGVIDVGEDFPLKAYAADLGAGMKLYYSAPVRRALDAAGFVLSADVAGLAETEAFWADRELVRTFPAVAARFPRLRVILGFSQQDHVQSAHAGDGHLHVQQLHDGLAASGLWRRANPDWAYLDLVYWRAGVPLPLGVPDNNANIPIPVGALHPLGQPASIRAAFLQAAMAVELADRVHRGIWAVNLPGVLVAH